MKQLFTRNFTLLLLGQASSLLGNYTLRFALSMFVLEETGSAATFAGILAVSMVPTILLSPLGGVLADRANRRNIMVALDTLSGLAVLGAMVLFPLGDRVFLTGALLVILSVLGAFESPTVQACVPQMVEESQLLRGNALVNQVSSLASLVTPFLGSLLYTPSSWGRRFASSSRRRWSASSAWESSPPGPRKALAPSSRGTWPRGRASFCGRSRAL